MRILLAFLLICGLAVPAQAKWVRAESEHFIGYSDGKDADLTADMVRLERFDALLRSRLGIPDDHGQTRLTVFFVRTIDAVQKLMPGKSRNVAGFYTASVEGALAVVPRASGGSGKFDLSSDIILFHEYAHHVMFQSFSASYPAWYIEGFAEFMSTAEFDKDGKAKLGLPALHRAYGLLLGESVGASRLLTASISDIKPEDMDPFYGRSWLLVHYLSFTQARAGQLTKYLTLINKGVGSLDAAQQAFGDLKVLDRDLAHYLTASKISYLSLQKAVPAAEAVKLVPLSDGEGASMLYRVAMMRGTPQAQGEAQAVAMRKIAADYPADPAVMTLLSEAEHDASHWQASIDAANAALRLDASISRAMLWKGEGMIQLLLAQKDSDAAKWKAARSWIIKANRASLEEATPLLLYYESFFKEGVPAPDLAVQGLAKALTLVPQEEGTRINYALALARQKKFAEARTTLAILANSPHGGKGTDFVRKLIDRISEAENAGDAGKLDGLETEAPVEDDPKKPVKKSEP